MYILLSIKPRFGEGILNGTKKYELRKQIWKQKVDKAILYFSTPIQAIMGHFTIGNIVEGTPEEIWKEISNDIKLSSSSLSRYFSLRNFGYAIEILNPIRYEQPINLRNKFPDLKAPQSFRYIPEDHPLMDLTISKHPS